MTSIFTDKTKVPTVNDLENALGDTYQLWIQLAEYTITANPKSFEEWKYSGEKYGWSFRICDKKRVIIYLLPRDQYFKIAFVFGQKATDRILESNISQTIVQELIQAKVYAEGRGIRIDVKDKSNLNDLFHLINIKITN